MNLLDVDIAEQGFVEGEVTLLQDLLLKDVRRQMALPLCVLLPVRLIADPLGGKRGGPEVAALSDGLCHRRDPVTVPDGSFHCWLCRAELSHLPRSRPSSDQHVNPYKACDNSWGEGQVARSVSRGSGRGGGWAGHGGDAAGFFWH